VISAQTYAAGAFDSGHHRLFSAIAGRVAIAIENAQLYQESQQRLRELTLLFDTSADVSVSLDARKVLETTAQEAVSALGAKGCTIFKLEPDHERLVVSLDYAPQVEGAKLVEQGQTFPLHGFPARQQALHTRQPIIKEAIQDVEYETSITWMEERECTALLIVPMVAGGKAVGLLEIMAGNGNHGFSPTQVRLCQTLANQAGAALENARLYAAAEARIREMSALLVVGRAMTTLELDQVLDSVAENALIAVQTELSSVYLLDEDRQKLYPASISGNPCPDEPPIVFDTGEGTIGWVAKHGEPLVVQDTTDHPIFSHAGEVSAHIKNTLTVPFQVKGKVIGVLEVCNKTDGSSFTATDQRLLSAFADQAAIAIENARLYQQLSHHLEEVQLLNQAAVAASTSLDFATVIHGSLSVLVGVRNFERVHVLILDEEKEDLWLHPSLSDLFPQRESFRVPLGRGVTGRVAETGTALLIADVRQESDYLPGYPDTLSELAVPMRVGDRIIGVLDAQSTKLDAFTDGDRRMLTTLASQLATVLDNVRLFEESQQRVRELTALVQVSQMLNKATDLATILNIVLEETFDLVGSKEGSIILIDPPDGDTLRMVAERGLGPELLESFNRRPVSTSEGTYKRALRDKRIIEVSDTSQDPDFLHDVGSQAQQITNIPLMTDRGAIGLIAVDGLPKDDEARSLLTALSDMAAVAIDKERLHRETSNRLAEVSTLYTLATQITSSLSRQAVLESIVTILRRTLDCRACSIFVIDSSGEYLRLEAASGPSSDWKGVARLRVGEGVSGQVAAERRPIYVPDTQAEDGFIYFDPQIRSLLVVPLVIRDEAVGTLSIDDVRPNAFDNELRLLTIAAAQAAVAIENADLYESLRQSYAELEQAYNELRELDKMKSEFVQNISHELRTPLTFIRGYVELLNDGEMGELNHGQKKAMEIVSSKSEALSQLVNDIISLQQASKDRLTFEAVSLTELGHQGVQACLASAAEADIKVVDEIPDSLPPVMADRQRLSQVFDNLLGNALKFSNPGDTVTVRMFEDEMTIRTEVEDTGIGINPEKLARIFDRFYQVDGTTTRRFGGTGLGLAITRQIVEAHGGQVGVESEPEQGSLFYFTLPKAGLL
jgi:GAF domain-containing protein